LYRTGQIVSSRGQNVPATWRFAATSSVEGGETVLRLEGRIGHSGAILLKQAGERVLDGGVDRLTLDLGGVDYLSSAGLRAIENLARALEKRAGWLRLMNATDSVRLVLDLSGLAERLTTKDPGRATKDEA
jgi:anti-anti-sigma factor